MMLNHTFIKLLSRVGIFFLMLGLGVSVAGFFAYMGETTHANKATMIAGMVMAAVGHLLVTSQALMQDEI